MACLEPAASLLKVWFGNCWDVTHRGDGCTALCQPCHFRAGCVWVWGGLGWHWQLEDPVKSPQGLSDLLVQLPVLSFLCGCFLLLVPLRGQQGLH